MVKGNVEIPTDNASGAPPTDLLTRERHARLLAGDEAAWHAFVTEYEQRMYGYLYRLEGNSEDALDLTQEVFYRAWRSMNTFRAGERVLPWLYQVARNTQIESHRRKQHQRFSLEEAREEIGFEVTSSGRSPVQAAESEQAQDRVQRALMKLPQEYREAVVLRFVEDLPYDEIARIQGVAPGTAKSRVFRAKEQLAELLADVADVH
ncbi:sigma-70 family RNA polymerase sigma factor [Deinococcus cavernae]|uniref:Sigma-70 family RNA polymerase sigma factor n=1 Tax=Deinococcus cavernae TaxID=2320857 RepID=A0A418VAT7_9DEIO|nr:sigma-70 family RNA polymerase sigma factor [Deinococcus cavernae]RJF73213.1 sigma-70 family RNA polymerase sigma factor [Deinococcus cavernae]